MGGIEGGDDAPSRAQKAAEDFAKAVAAIAHGEQVQAVAGAGGEPAASNGAGGPRRGQAAFEFVRDDENAHKE